MRALVIRTGGNQVQKLEDETKSSTAELMEIKAKMKNLEERISRQDTVVIILFRKRCYAIRDSIFLLILLSDKNIRSHKDTFRKSNKV